MSPFRYCGSNWQLELRRMASPRRGGFLVDESDLSREDIGFVCRIVGEFRVGANA